VFPREKILFDRIYVQQPAVAKDQFEVYFKFAKNVVEEIIEATAYRHGNHCILQADQKDLISTHNPNLVSISLIHNLIVSRVRISPYLVGREAPVPSQQLLQISLTIPDDETRKIAS
jgi:hypothetical protein